MKVWVLTEEFNDYNQNGEYFVAVFGTKPSADKLAAFVDPHSNRARLQHIANGGGREELEDHWYHLREKEAE